MEGEGRREEGGGWTQDDEKWRVEGVRQRVERGGWRMDAG